MDGNTLKTGSYELARSILGDDFIAPEEIADTHKLTYRDDQLKYFEDVLPTKEIIQWCHNNGFMLLAGPPTPMSLLAICNLKSQLFYRWPDRWYRKQKEKFSREDKVFPDWLMLCKAPFPNSMSKTWGEQRGLLSEEIYVPNASEIVWGITTYKEIRKNYLLPNVYVRTSSVVSDGGHALVGNFDVEGLNLSYNWDYDRIDELGVSSARKRN